MEINKDKFIEVFLVVTYRKYGYISIEAKEDREYIEFRNEMDSNIYFLKRCIDYFYLTKEIDLSIYYRSLCTAINNANNLYNGILIEFTNWRGSESAFLLNEDLEDAKIHIDRLISLKEYIELHIEVSEPIEKIDGKGIADIQKAYFFHFLFNEISKDIDKTEQAKLVSNLLDKSLNAKGYNENIYNYLREPFGTAKPTLNTRVEHLKETKKMFEVLKVERIVEIIDKEIEKLAMKIKK